MSEEENLERSSEHLANNLRRLREARGLSQSRLAALMGIPRPTLANLESGGSNPTLSVLLKVSATLQVSLEELVAPPRSSARLYPKGSLRVIRKGQVQVSELLPDALPGLQMERLELKPGAVMRGVPHTPGTREYLLCERGEITLRASGNAWTLKEGDALVFRGDQRHAYQNAGKKLATAITIVALAPPGESP